MLEGPSGQGRGRPEGRQSTREKATMSEWQQIETAPKDGTRILVWCDRACAIVWWMVDDVNLWTDGEYTWRDYWTHWKPLPEPPK
jgi:hypothetical protein